MNFGWKTRGHIAERGMPGAEAAVRSARPNTTAVCFAGRVGGGLNLALKKTMPRRVISGFLAAVMCDVVEHVFPAQARAG